MKEEDSTFGIVGLVCGIISLLIVPLLFASLGIIFSSIGLNKKQKFSKAGLIISIIGFLVGFILLAQASYELDKTLDQVIENFESLDKNLDQAIENFESLEDN